MSGREEGVFKRGKYVYIHALGDDWEEILRMAPRDSGSRLCRSATWRSPSPRLFPSHPPSHAVRRSWPPASNLAHAPRVISTPHYGDRPHNCKVWNDILAHPLLAVMCEGGRGDVADSTASVRRSQGVRERCSGARRNTIQAAYPWV